MTSYKCKECGSEFKSRKGVHAHLKAHKMSTEEYLMKHYPRIDLYTKKPIKYKNPDQYMGAYFNSASNMQKWCMGEHEIIVRDFLKKCMREKIAGRGDLVLGKVQLDSYKMPNMEFIAKLFGGYDKFCEEVGYKAQFDLKERPKEWDDDLGWPEMLIDTREQNPLLFKNFKRKKLDCGDYALADRNLFDYTFVDRKSPADFISTMSGGKDRFKREIKRCRDMGCYLFIVIDGSMASVEKKIAFSRHGQSSLSHIMHNMREILREFSGSCQFVFTSGRRESEYLIPKILYCGRKLWRFDVQRDIDKSVAL